MPQGDINKDLNGGSLSIKGVRILDNNRNLKVNTLKANKFNFGGRLTGSSTAFSEFETAITMNSSSGIITTPTATAAANGLFIILLTNSTISPASIVIAQVVNYSDSNTGEPIVTCVDVGEGTASIRVFNTGTAALNGVVQVGFLVF
jgi:hypothetical protein